KMTQTYLRRIDKRINPNEAIVKQEGVIQEEPVVPSAHERKVDAKIERVATRESKEDFKKALKKDNRELNRQKAEFDKQQKIIAHLQKVEMDEDAALYEDEIRTL